jgi:hypothetical protein
MPLHCTSKKIHQQMHNFRRVREIAKSDNQLRHIRPSVRTEQPGYHWTDFHEAYFSILRKSVKKIRRSIKI